MCPNQSKLAVGLNLLFSLLWVCNNFIFATNFCLIFLTRKNFAFQLLTFFLDIVFFRSSGILFNHLREINDYYRVSLQSFCARKQFPQFIHHASRHKE